MNFTEMLEIEKKNEMNVIDRSNKLLQHLPKGKLTVQEKNGKLYYRKSKDGNQCRLPAGDRQIAQLQARRLAEKVAANAENDLVLLDRMIRGFTPYDPNELIPTLSKAYQSVPATAVEALGFPYLQDFDGFESEDELHPEHLRHTDVDGKKKRSKSEIAISGIYRELGLHPMYEQTIVFPDGNKIHPDFTTWSSLRNTYMYHEHIGNLSDPDVLARTIWKFEELVRFGYFPFERFIFTYETADGKINMEYIKIMIQTFMS